MEEDWDLISVNVTEPSFGVQLGVDILRVHGQSRCLGPDHENGRPICCIHNPTDHHMLTWPQNWRGDIRIMERMCEHDIGHPDPDDLRVMMSKVKCYGCDGCCRPTTQEVAPQT